MTPTGPSDLELGRRAFRRSRERRSTTVAVVSTLGFTAVMVAGLVSTPGWPRVREQFLDLDVALDALPRIAVGLWLNVRVLVVASVLVVVVGLLLAVLRTTRGPVLAPLRLLATAYTDLFRGLPVIIVLYVVGLGLPGLRLQGITT